MLCATLWTNLRGGIQINGVKPYFFFVGFSEFISVIKIDLLAYFASPKLNLQQVRVDTIAGPSKKINRSFCTIKLKTPGHEFLISESGEPSLHQGHDHDILPSGWMRIGRTRTNVSFKSVQKLSKRHPIVLLNFRKVLQSGQLCLSYSFLTTKILF